MGSGQSVRATHFSQAAPPAEEHAEHRISISNKMVERLVEDATLTAGPPATPTIKPKRNDFKEKVYTEKIKSLDESHSERSKLTVDDINSLIRRIDKRTSNTATMEAVCPDYQERIIECYRKAEEAGDVIQCWGTIDEFSRCVQMTGAERLRERTHADEAANMRRERRVAHARHHALKDLGAP